MKARLMRRLRGAAQPEVEESPSNDSDARGPLIAAKLADGPMAGTTVEVAAVEGRPPKTVDVDGPGGACSRYCLAEWRQSGQSADYTFLYDV
jgi:hypothetical protein